MLLTTQLSGFNAFTEVAGAATSVIFKGTDIVDASQTSYTFSAKDLGTPSATRIVVVAVHQVGGTGSKTVTGTVDGVALTNIQQGTGRLHLAYAVVNTANVTGDIALTFSSAPARCAIGWWVLDGFNTTHSDVDSVFTTTDASRSLSALTIPSGGVGIIVGVNVAATAITTSISAGSIAEDYDTAATGMEYVGARTTDAGTPTITMANVSSMAGFAFGL